MSNQNNQINKKVFVVGTGRCGTTWIGQWLRQHPDFFGGPETHIFSILYNLINPEWSQGLKTWISEQNIIDEIRNFVTTCFYQCKFRKNQAKHLVEHSFVHYEYIDFIRKVFPDAIFIHPYRDGRNVVESYVRIHGQDSSSKYISYWNKIISDMMKTPRSYVFNIKYEDLIENTNISKSITQFIGVQHHKDIDNWEFPVNTPNFVYDGNRWKTLPDNIIEQFNSNHEFNLLLKKLKYSA